MRVTSMLAIVRSRNELFINCLSLDYVHAQPTSKSWQSNKCLESTTATVNFISLNVFRNSIEKMDCSSSLVCLSAYFFFLFVKFCLCSSSVPNNCFVERLRAAVNVFCRTLLSWVTIDVGVHTVVLLGKNKWRWWRWIVAVFREFVLAISVVNFISNCPRDAVLTQ